MITSYLAITVELHFWSKSVKCLECFAR